MYVIVVPSKIPNRGINSTAKAVLEQLLSQGLVADEKFTNLAYENVQLFSLAHPARSRVANIIGRSDFMVRPCVVELFFIRAVATFLNDSVG